MQTVDWAPSNLADANSVFLNSAWLWIIAFH
jgi:hypothetical protein